MSDAPVTQRGGSAPPAIELLSISKSFGPVRANRDISLSVAKGSIHGIVGENGAGKSTLMSILYGFYHADAGTIKIDGNAVSIKHSDDAIAAGIGMVHQHFMLVRTFSALENIILGAEKSLLLKNTEADARGVLEGLAKEYGLRVDLDAPVSSLSVGQQQRVEILKALFRQAEILILDEPTGVLTPAEADHLFRILQELKAQGKTIVFITHKLREIMDVTDTVSVMRRGEMSETYQTSDMSVEKLAEMMVGRSVSLKGKEKQPPKIGKTVLQVQGLSLTENDMPVLKNLSFDLREGEVLGIAGVAGNGQSELLDVLSGIKAASGGKVILNGAELDIVSGGKAHERRQMGMGHVPEDRHHRGLVMPFTLWENACFGFHRNPEFGGGWLSKPSKMVEWASRLLTKYDVRPNNPHLRASALSGGNQQKVIIAREVAQDPEILLVGQPTRGVDIGAIEYIHDELMTLRNSGKAVLLISVELDEILALSDRIIVMFDGAISGERDCADTDENDIGLLMAGIDNRGEAA